MEKNNKIIALLILVFMIPLGNFAQVPHDMIFSSINHIADEESLTALLGAGYTYQRRSRSYQKTSALSIKEGLKSVPGSDGKYIKYIKEIFVHASYLNEVFGSKEVIPGIKVNEKYDKALSQLKEHPSISYVNPSSDLNGKFIEFGYTPAGSPEVHIHLRFSPVKSKYRVVSLYVRNQKKRR